jgi:hypothetical protein
MAETSTRSVTAGNPSGAEMSAAIRAMAQAGVVDLLSAPLGIGVLHPRVPAVEALEQNR